MKKLLVVLLFLAGVSFQSKAQFYLGGGLGFGVTSSSKFNFYIAPDLGYNITNHFAVGAKISYETGYNCFGLDPYLRLNILKKESVVRILATVEAPLKWAPDYFSYAFYLRPGLSFRVGPKVRIEAHYGQFGWGSVKSGDITTSEWFARLDTNALNVGVIFGF